ncbi:helix-turn-helix domain-containing protein [Rhodococcus sp. USK13]|uniref:helix-turn-helix domain-containing protein n=1 Tax=Rhodococcus sp. USK13 TaxID=2806442 RepID=UPI0020163CB3|nr:helix-turn-helix domain-containing protein [Rhodococcus sp. USK13]
MSTKAHAERTNPRTAAAAGRKGRTGRAAGFSTVLEDALASVPEVERESFVLGVVGEDADGLDRALWGPGPSPAERKAAALVNLRRQYQARRAVVEASLTRPEAAELLDVSEQAVLDRLKAGDLVGLKKGREWRLPSWQFSADSELGFVPGLAKVTAVFAGGAVSLTEWALAPNSDLDGATPVEALAAGHVDDVVRAAQVGTAAAW